jgi:hypothetical protein
MKKISRAMTSKMTKTTMLALFPPLLPSPLIDTERTGLSASYTTSVCIYARAASFSKLFGIPSSPAIQHSPEYTMWPHDDHQIMPWPLRLSSYAALSPGSLLTLNPKVPPLLLNGRVFWPTSLSLGNGA